MGSAIGPTAGITVTPDSSDFGTSPAGVPVFRGFTVQNTGNTNLDIDFAADSGPHAGQISFNEGPTPCGATIAVGTTCEVRVGFAPDESGDPHQEASFTVTGSSPLVGEPASRSVSLGIERVAAVAAIEATGARVEVVRGDVSDFADLDNLIGGGTGDWDVPIGGMGHVSAELERAARAAGADLRAGADVTAVSAEGVSWHADGDEHHLRAQHVLWAAAPAVLDRLLGAEPEPCEGAQVKVNLLLSRLPRLRDGIAPEAAFGGTFHINESYSQLQAAYRQAALGAFPDPMPAEIYCHSLTDPTILGPDLTQLGQANITKLAGRAHRGTGFADRVDRPGLVLAGLAVGRRVVARLAPHGQEVLVRIKQIHAFAAGCLSMDRPPRHRQSHLVALDGCLDIELVLMVQEMAKQVILSIRAPGGVFVNNPPGVAADVDCIGRE